MVILLLGADIYKNIKQFEKIEKSVTYDTALLNGNLRHYQSRKKQTVACLDNEDWEQLIKSQKTHHHDIKNLTIPVWGTKSYKPFFNKENSFLKITTIGGQYDPLEFKADENENQEYRNFQHMSDFTRTENLGDTDILLVNTPPTGIIYKSFKDIYGLNGAYDFGNKNINKIINKVNPYWIVCCYDGKIPLLGDLKIGEKNEVRVICIPRNNKYMYLYDTENDLYLTKIQYKNNILTKTIQDINIKI